MQPRQQPRCAPHRPLPADHGFPVRVVTPGITGARAGATPPPPPPARTHRPPAVLLWRAAGGGPAPGALLHDSIGRRRAVKWVSKIIPSRQESQSQWQQRDYKSFNPAMGPDTVDWSSAPAIQVLPRTCCRVWQRCPAPSRHATPSPPSVRLNPFTVPLLSSHVVGHVGIKVLCQPAPGRSICSCHAVHHLSQQLAAACGAVQDAPVQSAITDPPSGSPLHPEEEELVVQPPPPPFTVPSLSAGAVRRVLATSAGTGGVLAADTTSHGRLISQVRECDQMVRPAADCCAGSALGLLCGA